MSAVQKYQVMPPLAGDVRESLKADIKARGVQIPVEYDENGEILDGHHRVRICGELGITEWPRITRLGLSETGKLTHARALNLARRQLNAEQRRALIGQQLKATPQLSDRQIAQQLVVSPSTVGRVRSELETSGELSKLDSCLGADGKTRPREVERPSGYRLEDQTPQGQRAILESSRIIRNERIEDRRQARMTQIAAMAQPSPELPGSRRYAVLYVDPPWKYEHNEADNRAIENQYPTMALEDIRALKVADICTSAAILFLWSPCPKLAEAVTVIEAWGFTYRTAAVWAKPQIGMGYYYRQQTELLLIATRGDMPAPSPADRPPSLVNADRGAHSVKPEVFYQHIEAMYPTLPRIELFARGAARPGWATWGNESEAAA